MLKWSAIIAAAVASLWGLLVYASPRPADQLYGKLIIAGALAVIALALFAERLWTKVVLSTLIIAVAGFTAYVWLKWSGRL